MEEMQKKYDRLLAKLIDAKEEQRHREVILNIMLTDYEWTKDKFGLLPMEVSEFIDRQRYIHDDKSVDILILHGRVDELKDELDKIRD